MTPPTTPRATAALLRRRLTAPVLAVSLAAALAPPPAAALPAVGPLSFLPGDGVRLPAVDFQGAGPADDQPVIAAGGPGYLVVWQDRRTVLGPLPLNGSAPFSRHLGNGRDIYAARLDGSGALLDAAPILITQAGHNQQAPAVAWNGSHWLVVWAAEQPQQFTIDQDLLAVRVATDGTLADAVPLVVRSAAAAGQDLYRAAVASDGTGWAVVWEEFNGAGVRGVRGARVGADGTLLDPDGVPIFYDIVNSYANGSAVAYNGSHYLVAWSQGGGQLEARRLTADLAPAEPTPFQIATFGAGGASIASDGSDFLVAWSESVNVNQSRIAASRVSAGGAVLDVGGLGLTEPLFTLLPPEVAWDGGRYLVAYGRTPAASDFTFDVHYRPVSAGGVIGDDVPVATGTANQGWAAVASPGDGTAQMTWTTSSATHTADVEGAPVAADGTPGSAVALSIGLPRQTAPRAASHAGGHLLVYLSEVSGTSRVLAQRLGPGGEPIGGPVEVAAGGESELRRPDVAWNGSLYLVVWEAPAGIAARRLGPDGVPLEPSQVVLSDHDQPAVAALAGDFLVAGTELHFFHEPQNWLSAARVRGSDGLLLDPVPALIRAGYELDPRVTALGGNWLVVWEAQARHDVSSSQILGALVSPSGVPGASFTIDGAGTGDDPDVALAAGGGALVVWDDNGYATGESRIAGRLLDAAGTPLGGEIVLADAAGYQVTPTVAASGDGWAVAWLDYRGVSGLEQLRGDVWTAALTAGGSPLGPAVQISTGPQPEEQPELMPAGSGSGSALLAYAAFPTPAETYRIGLRGLGDAAATAIFADGFESGDLGAWTTAIGAP